MEFLCCISLLLMSLTVVILSKLTSDLSGFFSPNAVMVCYIYMQADRPFDVFGNSISCIYCYLHF